MVFTAVLTAIAVIAAMVAIPGARAGAAEPSDFEPNYDLGAEAKRLGGDDSWGTLVWAGKPPAGAINTNQNNDVGWGWCIDYTIADPMRKTGRYLKSEAGAIRFDDPKYQNAAIGLAMKMRDATAAGDKALAYKYSVYLTAIISDASGRAAAIKFLRANEPGKNPQTVRPLRGFDGNSDEFTQLTGLRIVMDDTRYLDDQFEVDPSVTIPEQPMDAFITVVGPNGETRFHTGGGQRVVPIDQPGLPGDGGHNPGTDEENNPNPYPSPSESTEPEPSSSVTETTSSDQPTTEETTEPSEPSTTDGQTTEETTSETSGEPTTEETTTTSNTDEVPEPTTSESTPNSETTTVTVTTSETPSEGETTAPESTTSGEETTSDTTEKTTTKETSTESTEEPTPTPTTDVGPEPTPTTSQQEKPLKPEIKTQAKFDGDKQQVVAGATVIDTVHYEDLVPGKKYTLKAELRNKAVDANANGEHAVVGTGSQEFTAEAESGDVEVKINVDKQLESPIAAAVAYEKLFSSEVDKDGNDISGSGEEKEIANHEDINDEAQTVNTVWNPEIGTTAKFKDGNRVVEGATVIDTVTYKDLVPGKNYTLKAKLISKEDGTTVLGEATHNFTAEKSAGSEDVEIIVNDNAKDGATAAVAFEKLFSSEVDKDGNDISGSNEEKEIANHEDISDEAQTVNSELTPSIKTKAEFDDAKQVAAGVVVKDTVSYTDLVPGKEYTLKAELRNKAVNENGEYAVIGHGELSFTPETSAGEVVVDIKVNEDLEGVVEAAVAFEKLYSKQVDETGKDVPNNEGDGNEITTHEDINDEDQTVTSEEEPSESTTPEKPGEETCESTTPEKPGEETTPNKPGESTIPGKPGESTTPNDPCEETTPKTTEPTEPSESTTPREPGEESDKPKISTNADFANGATEVVAGAKVNDTVTYKGLVPGKEYTLFAELISKVDGESVLGEGKKTFTPTAANGEVVVEIIVDESVTEPVEAAVAFEELTSVEVNDKGEETPGTAPENPNHIAEHKDINDKNQTVPKPSEETTPNEPGEETTPNNPGEETTPNKPGEETTPNKPGESTTPGKPGEETTPNQPGEETTPNQPGEETTPNEPGEETTPNEPGEETTPNQPGEETTPNNPGEETTPNKPGEETTPNKPGESTTPGKPGEETTPNEPGEETTPNKSGDEPSESTTETPDKGDGNDKDDNDGSSKKSDLPWWLLLIPGLGLIKLIIDGGNGGSGGDHDGGKDTPEVTEDNGRGGDRGVSTGDNADEPSEQTGENTGRDDREITVLDATPPEDAGMPLPSNAERVEIKHVPSGATKLEPGMKDFIK